MSKRPHILIGKHIDRIEKTHDYIQLFFAEGTVLNIFNLYSIVDASNQKLTGYEIAEVKQSTESIKIFLLPEGTIQVGLRDSDYRGPEAMEYVRGDGPSVVWS
jgi:hypothetical protein